MGTVHRLAPGARPRVPSPPSWSREPTARFASATTWSPGSAFGKVRALIDDCRQAAIKEAGPSTPVVVTGLSGTVLAGLTRSSRSFADRAGGARSPRPNSAGFAEKLAAGAAGAPDHARRPRPDHLGRRHEVAQPRPQGRGQRLALRSLAQPGHGKIQDPTVKIKVVGEGVGAVSESPMSTWRARSPTRSSSRLQRPSRRPCAAPPLGEEQGVDVRFYDVQPYWMTDDIEKAVKGPVPADNDRSDPGSRRSCAASTRWTASPRSPLRTCSTAGSRETRPAACCATTRRSPRAASMRSSGSRTAVREVTHGYDLRHHPREDFGDFREGDILEAAPTMEAAERPPPTLRSAFRSHAPRAGGRAASRRRSRR